jgi:hypothetical protein
LGRQEVTSFLSHGLVMRRIVDIGSNYRGVITMYETAIEAAEQWDSYNTLTTKWIYNELDKHGITLEEFYADPDTKTITTMTDLYYWLGY